MDGGTYADNVQDVLSELWRSYTSGRGSYDGVPVRLFDAGMRNERLGCTFPLGEATAHEWSRAIGACLRQELHGHDVASSILRWDLPNALFSYTMRLAASPIGFIFGDLSSVTSVGAPGFAHDAYLLHSSPGDLASHPERRPWSCARHGVHNATAYAVARTQTYVDGRHLMGGAALSKSEFHCWQPRELWNSTFEFQRAYVSSLVSDARCDVSWPRDSRSSGADCTCHSIPGHHGGLYNQVHLSWRGTAQVRAIVYVNATTTHQAKPPSGAPLRPRFDGHEYTVGAEHAARAAEAAHWVRYALAHFACSLRTDRLNTSWRTTLAALESAILAGSVTLPAVCAGVRDARLLPVVQFVTQLPEGWCAEAHATRERQRVDPHTASRFTGIGFRDFPFRVSHGSS